MKKLFLTTILTLFAFTYTAIADTPYQGNVPYSATSGVQSNTAQSIVIPILPGKAFYLTSVSVYGAGATIALEATCSITNTAATVVANVLVNIPAGVTAAASSITEKWVGAPLYSGGLGTAFTVACPAFGLGNTAQVINVSGYYY